MGDRLANFLTRFLEGIAERPWGVQRLSAPVAGSRYRVRSRLTATVVLLPLGSATRRIPISLPPTTTIVIHAATRPDLEHVYAMVESMDAIELLPPDERASVRAAGYLLEIPRRVLRSQCLLF